jgi:hypothetical protein
MEHYAGIDVSLESSSVCAVDATGRIVREAKVTSDPGVLTAWFKGLGVDLSRIGLEAGPLSQWLYAAMREAGLAVELLETRHVRTAFKIMPVKTDRKDARGIAFCRDRTTGAVVNWRHGYVPREVPVRNEISGQSLRRPSCYALRANGSKQESTQIWPRTRTDETEYWSREAPDVSRCTLPAPTGRWVQLLIPCNLCPSSA